MAKTRLHKEEALKDLTKRLQEMKSSVFFQHAGLTVHDTEELRSKLRERGADLAMVKRRILQLALKDAKLEGVDVSSMEGSLGVSTSTSDVVAPANVIHAFVKDHESMHILGGVLVEGENITVMDPEKVTALAKIPSREELLSKMVGSMNAPISGIVQVLAGSLRSFVNVLNALKDQKA